MRRLRDLVGGALLLAVALPLAAALSPADVASDTPVSQLIKHASSALSAGAPQDALAFYEIAVERDPKNYLTFFKRGATYLSMGRATQALADFDRVLEIRPGFEGALTQRAKIRARSGNWQGARDDFTSAGRAVDSEDMANLAEAEQGARLAKEASKQKDWETCVTQASVAIMTAVTALDLRNLRVRCRFEKGEITEALGDLQAIQQLNAGGASDAPMQIAAMTFYSLGEIDKGVEATKKCLHNDPDSKPCSKLFKKQKRIQKSMKKVRDLFKKRSYSGAVKLLGKTNDDEIGIIETVQEDLREYRLEHVIHQKAPEELLSELLEMTCDAYIEMNNFKRAQPFCTDLRARRPDALPGLVHQAQAQLDADDFEGAIRTLNSARDAPGGQQNRRVNEMLQTAQTRLKQSKTKDYYKVLEVGRDASDKEIKKSYRKLSKANHPDKAGSPEARPAAEKKMAAINEAYEVLSDPELKQRYDAGDDPNDPMAGRGGPGGNPFQGGGHPFGAHGGQQQFVFRSGPGGGGFPFGGAGGGGGGGPFKFQFGGGGGGGGFPFG